MNWDRVEGNWKTFKGQVQQKWGKLTDDDLDVIEGKRTELAGRLQERYGYAKDEAEKNIDTWLKTRTIEPDRPAGHPGRPSFLHAHRDNHNGLIALRAALRSRSNARRSRAAAVAVEPHRVARASAAAPDTAGRIGDTIASALGVMAERFRGRASTLGHDAVGIQRRCAARRQ